MANTKIPSELIADNSVGITQLNVSDGTNGQALVTDGSGTLSFSTISGYTDSDVETYLDSGVSTPTFSTASATTEFNLGNSFSRVADVDGAGAFAGGYNLYLDGSANPLHDSGGALSGYYYKSDGTISFYAANSQVADTAAREVMRIDDNHITLFGNGDGSEAYIMLDIENTGSSAGIALDCQYQSGKKYEIQSDNDGIFLVYDRDNTQYMLTMNNGSIEPKDYSGSLSIGLIDDGSWTARGIGGSNGSNRQWAIGHNSSQLYFANSNHSTGGLVTFLQVDQNQYVYLGGQSQKTTIGSTTNSTVELTIDSTDAVKIPVGTTAQRPTGANGMIRYNSTEGRYEGYSTDTGGWDALNVGVIESMASFSGQAGQTYTIKPPGATSSFSAVYSGDNYKGSGYGFFRWWRGYGTGNANPASVSLDLVGNGYQYYAVMVEDEGNNGGGGYGSGIKSYEYAVWSSLQTFNSLSSNSNYATSHSFTTGNSVYAMWGGNGGHGLYDSSVNGQCNWGNGGTATAIGAGYDGSCGVYPNSLRLGRPQTASANYQLSSTQFSYWFYF